MTGWTRGAAALVLAGLTFAACGAERGAAEPDAKAVVVPDGTAPDSGQVAADTSGSRGSGLPELPGEGAPREYRLLLVNPHDHEARVFASAGASRVALDTVPARDSIRVDIRLRADRVLLEAEDERGGGVGSIELDLSPGAPNRWEIGTPPGPRVTRAGP